jgi:AraC family transcriptional regulator
MLYTQFPDLQWLKKQAEEGFANRKAWAGGTLQKAGWPSVIMQVKTPAICRDNIRGPLSVFSNMSGQSKVSVEKNQVTVREDFFFITNHDQHYTLEVDRNHTAETFNIHFGEYDADQVFRTLSLQPEKLLDECSFSAPAGRVEFYNKLYYRDPIFNSLAEALKNSAGNKLHYQEKLHDLLVYLLRQHSEIKKIAEKIPVLKNSTRTEILKRLSAATDFIYASYHLDISLEELARVSCLSKFHFLRLFKIAFRKTPHQFVNELKVNQAKKLLQNPDIEIRSIARSLGFENASSFSRMFYQQTGFYPSQGR